MLHHLSDRLFWDVNPALLDWEKDMLLIITRVVERGTLDEWKVVERQYGLQKIVMAAKEIRSLDIRAANFLARISDTPLTEFRCYNTKQLHRQHWTY